MAVVFRLRELSRAQTIIINLLFAAGFLASAAGGVRTYFTWVMTTSPDFDATWHGQLTWLSSILELNIGIVRSRASSVARRLG